MCFQSLQEQRILERLENFLNKPVVTLTFLSTFLESGDFPNNLTAPDRH
jgi:hypothetical protein